jgi:hypothetical protein
MLTLTDKFKQGLVYLPSGCIERKPNIRFQGKIYRAKQVAWHLESGRWVSPLYNACGNPNCVNAKHLSPDKPDGYFLQESKSIVCWGETFETVQKLWEHPRCTIRTPELLEQRLRRMKPEEAVRLRNFKYDGKRYRSISSIPLPRGITLPTLRYRLGCIYGSKKVSVEHALDNAWWREVAPSCLVRDNIYRFTTLQPRPELTEDEIIEVAMLMRDRLQILRAVPKPEAGHIPTTQERCDISGSYFDAEFVVLQKRNRTSI